LIEIEKKYILNRKYDFNQFIQFLQKQYDYKIIAKKNITSNQFFFDDKKYTIYKQNAYLKLSNYIINNSKKESIIVLKLNKNDLARNEIIIEYNRNRFIDINNISAFNINKYLPIINRKLIKKVKELKQFIKINLNRIQYLVKLSGMNVELCFDDCEYIGNNVNISEKMLEIELLSKSEDQISTFEDITDNIYNIFNSVMDFTTDSKLDRAVNLLRLDLMKPESEDEKNQKKEERKNKDKKIGDD
jgi:hypothetical protein